MSKATAVLVAYGKCPQCSADIKIKMTKSEHLTYICNSPAEGGCGHQYFARFAASDTWVAKNVCKKWVKDDARNKFLPGSQPDPDPEPDPVDEPEPDEPEIVEVLEPDDDPEPELEPAKDWWC